MLSESIKLERTFIGADGVVYLFSRGGGGVTYAKVGGSTFEALRERNKSGTLHLNTTTEFPNHLGGMTPMLVPMM